MNINKNSLVIKTFTYLISFSIALLLLLYISQIVFFNYFYEKIQLNNINRVANNIMKTNNLIDIEKIAYDNNICIELKINNDYYNYNTLNRDCILNIKNKEINNIKNKLFNSNRNIIMSLNNPNNNSKNLFYGIKYSDNTNIILNTSLEDVNSVSYALRGQFIYITMVLIVLAISISYYISRILNKPILEITNKARLMAKGDFESDDSIYGIKEIDDLNEVLNYARSEIKNTDDLRKDLMANVGHDLKTPLTMIKAYAEMCMDINKDDEVKRENNLNIIIDEVDRLSILVNDILDLSKLENNNILDIEEYDLVKEIGNIINKYEIIKETENYTFDVNMPLEANVKADKNKINQVIYNLINNAINYTGDDLTVRINLLDLDSKYKIEIIDSGKGISKKELSYIWTKYYKNDKNHKRNIVGTGLGLSIVKNILDCHDFEYGIISKKGKGSNFYFYINK